LQVWLLLYERFRYGASLPPLKWAAIVLILALQAYLVLAPNEDTANQAMDMEATSNGDTRKGVES
jgi:hypothetical protein